jgi:hypothetical protein
VSQTGRLPRREIALLAKIGKDAVVVGPLHLIAWRDSEEFAVDSMTYGTESRPG